MCVPTFSLLLLLILWNIVTGQSGISSLTSVGCKRLTLRSYIFNCDFRVPAEKSQGTGIHWQVAQATCLINIVFEMSSASNTAHQGACKHMSIAHYLTLHRYPRYLDGEWEVSRIGGLSEQVLMLLEYSGGFMGDLVFNGGQWFSFSVCHRLLIDDIGKFGIWGGNQQSVLGPCEFFLI